MRRSAQISLANSRSQFASSSPNRSRAYDIGRPTTLAKFVRSQSATRLSNLSSSPTSASRRIRTRAVLAVAETRGCGLLIKSIIRDGRQTEHGGADRQIRIAAHGSRAPRSRLRVTPRVSVGTPSSRAFERRVRQYVPRRRNRSSSASSWFCLLYSLGRACLVDLQSSCLVSLMSS